MEQWRPRDPERSRRVGRSLCFPIADRNGTECILYLMRGMATRRQQKIKSSGGMCVPPVLKTIQKKIMDTVQKKYPIYKGLQRPLVFKMFRGKFIYWAAAIVAGGVVVAGIITAFISSIAGLLVLFGATVPGLFWVLNKQKAGLYHKKRDKCIAIHKPKDAVN